MPDFVLELPQNIAGSSPPARLRLRVNGNDLSTDGVKITVPSVIFDSSAVRAGQDLAYGTFMQSYGGGVLQLTACKINSDGSVEVRGYGGMANNETRLLLVGRIAGNSGGGWTAELSAPVKVQSASMDGYGSYELDLYTRSGLFQLPASTSPITITTEFISSSSKLEEPVPVRRIITQPLSFVQPSASLANIFSIKPVFMHAGRIVSIYGSNFGASPVVQFQGEKGERYIVEPASIESGKLEVMVPFGIADGPIQVDNGSGPGNTFMARLQFGPTLEVTPANKDAAESPITMTVYQSANQNVWNNFQLDLLNVDRALSGLPPGTVVGSYKIIEIYKGSPNQWSELELRVESSSEAKLVIIAAYKGSSAVSMRIEITKITGTTPGLRFTVAPWSNRDGAVTVEYPLRWEFIFSDLALKFPTGADTPMGVSAAFTSAPVSASGADGGVTVDLIR